MKHRKLTVVAAASALFLTMHLPATAQGLMEDMIIKRMKNADKNKDGLISREEAQSLPRLEKNFDAIDTNKDNQLAQEERVAFRVKSKK
jgi:hypothetical protein